MRDAGEQDELREAAAAALDYLESRWFPHTSPAGNMRLPVVNALREALAASVPKEAAESPPSWAVPL
jgi:hypothetical protein